MTSMLLIAMACKGKDDTGAVEGVESEDLGTYTTDTAGLTGDIEATVPSGTSSMLVACGPYGDSLLGTAWSLASPSGDLVYTNEFHPSFVPTAMRVGNHDDYLPVLFPVSPDLDIMSGAYSLNVWIAANRVPTDVRCKALYRTAEVGANGIVDLHVVIVSADGMTASSAKDDADWSSVLDTVKTLWGGANLSIGDVSYEDFSGSTSTYAVVDMASGEFNDLLRTARPPNPQALTIFLVDEINDLGSTTLGLSAGPPGAATLTGTSKSGMVVSTVDLRGDADTVARIIAHEGGHFLGLFHTSEKDGTRFDPLSDTPECAASSDINHDGVVAPSECSGKGADNLMWWSESADARDLSDDQSWVLRRNPAVR